MLPFKKTSTYETCKIISNIKRFFIKVTDKIKYKVLWYIRLLDSTSVLFSIDNFLTGNPIFLT